MRNERGGHDIFIRHSDLQKKKPLLGDTLAGGAAGAALLGLPALAATAVPSLHGVVSKPMAAALAGGGGLLGALITNRIGAHENAKLMERKRKAGLV